MNSNILDIKQCAEFLNISISLIRKLVRKKEIPFYRIGAKLLFSKSEIENWLKTQQNNQY